MTDVVHYRVSMTDPHSHLFEVEARFPAGEPSRVVSLPVWTPGSYLVREYARHVQDLSATTADGDPLPVTRSDKRSVTIATGRAAATLRYRVYANELTVRTSHLDGTHGYFNGATLFFCAEELRDREHRVEVITPPNWKAFCALEQRGPHFVASSYDELVDSPFEVGPHSALTFSAAGVPHEVVVWGEGSYDREKMTRDLTRICETEAAMFGALPMRRYLFLLYLSDKGRGGLEHMASTALLYPRASLTNAKGWEDFLTLAAHEYFHLWNVKRIKPKAFVPFDYSQEAYTKLLWAFEGITSYYDNLVVRRAGLMTPARYLGRLGETLTTLYSTPGRRTLTLSDASMWAWIKHYRPDENSPNSAISYYLKGEVVALLLDLELRRATKDQKSLDDLMRLLWQRYGDGKGVPEDGVEAAAREVGGQELRGFFDRALRSTEELDLTVLSHVGLEARFRVRESPSDKGGSAPRVKPGEERPRGWLGVLTRGASTIATVLDGSPAREAGVYADDEIVALDGQRVDAAGLQTRCDEQRPGDRVVLTVFRRDRLTEIPVTLAAKPTDAVWLARVEQPSEQQKAAYKGWVSAGWDELPPAPQG